jgi:epoxyqueuosine reductase
VRPGFEGRTRVTAASPPTPPPVEALDLVAGLRGAARDLGFDVASIAPAALPERDLTALSAWLREGRAGEMSWMGRTERLRRDPSTLLAGAASVVTVAVAHAWDAPPFRSEGRYGRVARYAWGRDYHDVVLPRLRALADRLSRLSPTPLAARCLVDAEPFLERAAAAAGGLGFVGKNTNVIRPHGGSYWLLGEILVDATLPPTSAPSAVSCGTCRRCLDACPTNAFVDEYRLDSRRCVSYLTIEAKGPIPRDLRAGLGPWVFGCDVCQEVCPFNRFAPRDAWPELSPAAGVGPRLDLVETLSIASDEAFRARFAGTPLLRPKRRGLLRNAATVAANVGAEAAIPALARLAKADPEAVVRTHALDALVRLDPRRGKAAAEERRNDPDPAVREEARVALACPES